MPSISHRVIHTINLLPTTLRNTRDNRIYLFKPLRAKWGGSRRNHPGDSTWTKREISQAEIDSITDIKLCKKHRGPISAYLQHCTKKRASVDRGLWISGPLPCPNRRTRSPYSSLNLSRYRRVARRLSNPAPLIADAPGGSNLFVQRTSFGRAGSIELGLRLLQRIA